MMLGEICAYLKNWFEAGMYHAEFCISGGAIHFHDGSPLPLKEGQYFRIIGSVFNDGVWQYSSELTLKDETFDGTVWAMRVPPDLIAIMAEIEEWMKKYGSVDSEALSPYNSESFGGYSYSKSVGGAGSSNGGTPTWDTVFGGRLERWRRL